MVKLFTFERDKGKDDAKDDDGGFFSKIFKRDAPDAKDVKAEKKGERVILRGRVPDQPTRERAIVSAGNNRGVAEVEDQMEVEDKAPKPQSTMYTVKSGDTLSKIAKAHYGDPQKYPVIFEANRPMLEDPDKIYPGQVLRIPPEEGARA